MKILAIDTGTRTGWAYRTDVGRIEFGREDFSLSRGESPGMRYLRFGVWLREIVAAVRPRLIVYEQIHQRGGAPTEVAAGFVTRIQEHCAVSGIEHAAVHSGSLKKFATGHGQASKEKMIEAAELIYIRDCGPACCPKISHDEADAIHLLLYAERKLCGLASGTVEYERTK